MKKTVTAYVTDNFKLEKVIGKIEIELDEEGLERLTQGLSYLSVSVAQMPNTSTKVITSIALCSIPQLVMKRDRALEKALELLDALASAQMSHVQHLEMPDVDRSLRESYCKEAFDLIAKYKEKVFYENF